MRKSMKEIARVIVLAALLAGVGCGAKRIDSSRFDKSFEEVAGDLPAEKGSQLVMSMGGVIVMAAQKGLSSDDIKNWMAQELNGLTGWEAIDRLNFMLKEGVPPLAGFAPRSSPKCISNLKQIVLAFRIYAHENNGSFPFDVSKKRGGTLELTNQDENGDEIDPALHLNVMSRLLGSPKLLQCPSDSAAEKRQHPNAWPITGKEVSYRLQSGAHVKEIFPKSVLVWCPIHNNYGLCNGKVLAGSAQSLQEAIAAGRQSVSKMERPTEAQEK